VNSIHSAVCDELRLNRRRGLQAIPYLVFRNTNLSDAGALFLSYVLEKHALPQYLNPITKPTHLTKQLDEYAPQTGCHGLIYLPNEGMSKDSRKLLELAEMYRAGQSYANDHPLTRYGNHDGAGSEDRTLLISPR
jgi:hypothetical protein